jgi:hypothetical protein
MFGFVMFERRPDHAAGQEIPENRKKMSRECSMAAGVQISGLRYRIAPTDIRRDA